jgi:hypothetical protein
MISALIVLATVLLISLLATPAPAQTPTVNLEYLGPYPLIPTPVANQANTLCECSGSATVGNTGSESSIVTFQLTSKDPDFSHFKATFSVNNFTLLPGQRKTFTLTLTFDSSTPGHSYNASIAILARSAAGGSGAASFNLPVSVAGANIPEFTEQGTFLLTIITTLTMLGFMKLSKRRRK